MTEFEQREILAWFMSSGAQHIVNDHYRHLLVDLANLTAAMTGSGNRFDSAAAVDAFMGRQPGEAAE